jgi:fructokinase
MRYDVIALGELLIDFTDNGLSGSGNALFEANPGGAPGNVLAMLRQLNRNAAFIGKVGDDFFGRSIIKTLENRGIDTQGILCDENVNTTLAFVHNRPDGDREFTFFRNPGADTRLSVSDVPEDMIQNTSIFHFGSLSLTHEPARSATKAAVDSARRSGAIVSFDPNLRPLLWDGPEAAKEQIAWGCGICDILKISDEEALFLTGCEDTKIAAARLRSLYPDVRMLFVTKGKLGSEAYWGDLFAEQPTFDVDTIDTTGAGDAFFGCCLSFVPDLDLDDPDGALLNRILVYANAAAALVTTKRGALSAMPTKESIENLIGL